MGLNYKFFNAEKTKELRLMMPFIIGDMPYSQYVNIVNPTEDMREFYKYFDQFTATWFMKSDEAQSTDPTADVYKYSTYFQNAGSRLDFKPEDGALIAPCLNPNTEPYDGTGNRMIDLVEDGPWYNGTTQLKFYAREEADHQQHLAVDVTKDGKLVFTLGSLEWGADQMFAVDSAEEFLENKNFTYIEALYPYPLPVDDTFPFGLRRAYKTTVVLDKDVGEGYGSPYWIQFIYRLLTETDVEEFDPEYPYEGEGETGGHPIPPTFGGIGLPNLPNISLNGYAYNVYQVNPSQLGALMADLWDETWLEDLLDANEYKMSNIVSLHFLPFDRHAGTAPIQLGNKQSSQGQLVSEWQSIECGTHRLDTVLDNYLMNEPHCNIELYLPYVGMVDLVPSKVTKQFIKVTYHVHVPTGYATCYVQVGGGPDPTGKKTRPMSLYASFSCNMAVQAPIASNGNSTLMSGIGSLVNSGVSAVQSAASHDYLNAAGSVAGAALTIAKCTQGNTSTKGTYSGVAGLLNVQKPYIIRSYPNYLNTNSSTSLTGKPTYKFGKLSQMGKGYIRVRSSKLDSVQCSDSVKSQIEAYLKGGVYL